MKNLLFITLILVSINSFGQLYDSMIFGNSIQMTATQTTTSIDPKFEVMQRSVIDAKRQIKQAQNRLVIIDLLQNKIAARKVLD